MKIYHIGNVLVLIMGMLLLSFDWDRRGPQVAEAWVTGGQVVTEPCVKSPIDFPDDNPEKPRLCKDKATPYPNKTNNTIRQEACLEAIEVQQYCPGSDVKNNTICKYNYPKCSGNMSERTTVGTGNWSKWTLISPAKACDITYSKASTQAADCIPTPPVQP